MQRAATAEEGNDNDRDIGPRGRRGHATDVEGGMRVPQPHVLTFVSSSDYCPTVRSISKSPRHINHSKKY